MKALPERVVVVDIGSWTIDIMLLGAALGAGTVRVVEGATGRGGMDSTAMKAADDTRETDDRTMMELVDGWG